MRQLICPGAWSDVRGDLSYQRLELAGGFATGFKPRGSFQLAVYAVERSVLVFDQGDAQAEAEASAWNRPVYPVLFHVDLRRSEAA